MKIFVTGATGLIGLDLCAVLAANGHTVYALTRSEKKVGLLQQAGFIPVLGHAAVTGPWLQQLKECDAVINLAGQSIFGKRWTEKYKAVLRSSRIDTTRKIAGAVSAPDSKVRILLSGSAVGYYGADVPGDSDEDSAAGTDFLAQLCVAWERAACVSRADVRTVFLRTGIVLSVKGGVIGKLLPLFRFGLGGRLGSGLQMMSWIHIEDWVRAVLMLLENDQIKGAVNLTAPYAVTNAGFTRALAGVLRRPAMFPAPAAVMKMVLGEASEAVLGHQLVRPKKLMNAGFIFTFPEIHLALTNLLRRSP